MAQGDLFQNFYNQVQGVNQQTYEMKVTLDTLMAGQANIFKARREMLKSDTESLNILKRTKSVNDKIYSQIKDNYKMQKNLANTKKDLNKLEDQIAKAQEKANKTGQINDKLAAKALVHLRNRQRTEYEIAKVQHEQMTRSIPLLGQMGSTGLFFANSIARVVPVFGAIFKVGGFLLGSLIKIGKTIIKLILAPLKKAFSTFLEIQSTVGNLAADIGLSELQSKGLLTNFQSLTLSAMKFGGSMKDVAAIIKNFTDTTNKNRLFNEKEVEQLTELGLGTGLGVQGATELAASFDNIGISLSNTIKLTDKARNIAAKYNINTTKVLKTYQGLVTSLTGIGFGKGLDNLTKLAAKAVAIRFDIEKSTEKFKDAFFEPEKAVEAAAKMQVLGGKFAQNFGDPMQLAFESMSEPQKLAERVTDLVRGSIVKSGDDFIIPPAERKMLRMAAETLGQDYNEMQNAAIEQAKMADKMELLGKKGIKVIDEEEMYAFSNLIAMGEKGYEVKLSSGATKLLSEIRTKGELDKILDDRKKNEKAAMQRLSMMQRLQLVGDRFIMGISQVFDKLFGGGSDFESFLGMVEKTGQYLSNFILDIFKKGNGFTEMFEQILKDGMTVFEKIKNIFSEENEASMFKKLGQSVSMLFTEFVLPSIVKLFNYIRPLLDYTFGSFLEVIGEILPDMLGGSKARRKGLEMQQRAFDQGGGEGGIMRDIFGEQGVVEQKEKVQTEYDKSKKISGGEKVWNFLTGGIVGAVNSTGNLLNYAFTDMKTDEFLKKQGLIQSELFSDLTFGYTDKFTGYDPYEKGKSYKHFDDGVIYKDGSYSTFAKGDMVQFIDQAAMERAGTGSNSSGSSNTLQHSGVITIKSDDGKVVTWDQMYGARDLIGSRMSSINESYENGFGNYQNPYKSPIQPLI
jgi:hypothetical protein